MRSNQNCSGCAAWICCADKWWKNLPVRRRICSCLLVSTSTSPKLRRRYEVQHSKRCAIAFVHVCILWVSATIGKFYSSGGRTWRILKIRRYRRERTGRRARFLFRTQSLIYGRFKFRCWNVTDLLDLRGSLSAVSRPILQGDSFGSN